MGARKDFAQKKRRGNGGASPSRRSAPPRPAPQPRRTPRLLLVVVLIAVAILGFGLYRLTTLQGRVPVQVSIPAPNPVAPAPKPAPKASTQGKSQQQASDERKNRFDFYEMLPKSEVQAPKVDAYKSTPRNAELPHSYLLQVASFRNESDADHLRAKLLLAGLPNVHTSRVDGSNGTWYRVRTGPFDTVTEMNKAEDKLARLRIVPIEIKQ